jgi:tRNA(Ile)-lysidine synthase
MLLPRIKKTIQRHHLLSPQEKVVAACSGGPDSVALLHLLIDLDWGLKITVAHFNHRLRKAADGDEHFTRNLAGRFSLRFESKREDIRKLAQTHDLNLEEAGRIRRYAFFEEVAARTGSTRIALGHTLSDQAETVLMHLFRGAGVHGLGGIRPVRNNIIRPLIDITREEILTCLNIKKWDYRVDETNDDTRFLRSRIRNRIMPFLEEQIHSNIQARLGTLADIIREEDEYLQSLVREACQTVERKFQDRPALDKSQLDQLPLALRRRVIREFLRRLRGDTAGLTFKDIERCLDLEKEQLFPLEKDLVLKNIRGLITRKPEEDAVIYDFIWDGASSLNIPETGQSFTLETQPNPGIPQLEFNDWKRAWLDAGKLTLPLEVRSRRAGDRYRPLGAPGRKALKEIFRSRNIAPDIRDRCPVVLSRDKIVWVVGLPPGHAFRVTDKTTDVVKIEVRWEA